MNQFKIVTKIESRQPIITPEMIELKLFADNFTGIKTAVEPLELDANEKIELARKKADIESWDCTVRDSSLIKETVPLPVNRFHPLADIGGS